MTLIKSGDMLLLCHRRLYREDLPRHFVGVVDECEGQLTLITGTTFLREAVHVVFMRKPGLRTKVVSLGSGGLIIYKLPKNIHLDSIQLQERSEERLILTDGEEFEMDLSERMST